MNKIETPIEGLFILETKVFKDERGVFQKLFTADVFEGLGLNGDFKELYYSVNHKGVIRGMHFQTPPCDHEKMVYVSSGRIIDVVVDLRKNSNTYGKHFSIELTADSGKYIYIPRGMAHGFISLEEGTIVNYAQTSVYAPSNDSGILYNSFGYEWPVENPIVSGRDLTFVSLNNFDTCFE